MTEDTSTGHECPTAYGAIGDGSVQTTLIGGAAACLSHIMHHPLYTLKSQMMFHGHNFRLSDFIRKALTQRTDFLYRGLVQRTIGVAPEKMMKMLLWDKVNILIDNNYNTSVYTKWLISGAAAGAATTVVGCPSERVMVLAQIRKEGFFKVFRTTGFKGLYLGWTATLYRDITFNMVFFTTRELFVSQYESRWEPASPVTRVVLGLPAGVLASVVACPFDVIKTRMQGVKIDAEYQSCSTIFKNIVKKEGPRNLMKGLTPRLVAVPSMMSWWYVINEELIKLFYK